MQQAGWQRPGDRRGFTLVELLLAVGLLVLLLGAVVFSFSSLQRGVVLDEGTTQLEALLRFARAHAAGTGRVVEIRFEEEFDDAVTMVSGQVHVVWEPDPLAHPGQFEDLTEALPYARALADSIHIDRVRPWTGETDAGAGSGPHPETGTGGAGRVGTAATETTHAEAEQDKPSNFWPIRFYADGSADSIEIILGSMDEDDTRQVALEFMGMTGTFRRRYLAPEFPAASGEAGQDNGGEPVPNRTE